MAVLPVSATHIVMTVGTAPRKRTTPRLGPAGKGPLCLSEAASSPAPDREMLTETCR